MAWDNFCQLGEVRMTGYRWREERKMVLGKNTEKSFEKIIENDCIKFKKDIEYHL